MYISFRSYFLHKTNHTVIKRGGVLTHSITIPSALGEREWIGEMNWDLSLTLIRVASGNWLKANSSSQFPK